MNEWRLVFWMTFAVFVVTTIVYVIWASGEVQPWNEPENVRMVENGDSKRANEEPIGLKASVLGVEALSNGTEKASYGATELSTAEKKE